MNDATHYNIPIYILDLSEKGIAINEFDVYLNKKCHQIYKLQSLFFMSSPCRVFGKLWQKTNKQHYKSIIENNMYFVAKENGAKKVRSCVVIGKDIERGF